MANYAFIDGNNLYKGMTRLRWKLDMDKFRKYLRQTHHTTKEFYFIGDSRKPSHIKIRQDLAYQGYIIITKPVMIINGKQIKGNCDAELILQAMIEFQNYNNAIIVSSDGDFYCLARHLKSKNKLGKIIVPRKTKASALLKRSFYKYLVALDPLRDELEF